MSRSATRSRRRAVPIRLDPLTDHPFDRTGFHHPNLIAWIDDHRSELVHANLTLGQALGGRRDAQGVARCRDVRGLVRRGIKESPRWQVCPICENNWDEWNESRPSDSNLIRKVVAAWRAEFGDRQVKARKLLPVIGLLLDIDPGGEHASETASGSVSGGCRVGVVDGFEIIGHDVSGSRSWRLVPRS